MNYEDIGFRCGIEIHNRLDTKRKLFCGCSPGLSEERPYAEIRRRLRASAGETGETDRAAKFETERGRDFTYQLFNGTTCLVEADEEPPSDIDAESLEICLRLAKSMGCFIPEEIHVMRKTVVDGSNTSGFQRTALVGMNGKIETSPGKVRISGVSVEEESAGIVSKEPSAVYRLDRLGVPLVEIGTETDIKNPTHAKDTAKKLGMLIRATGKSQRGIGSIRQDINVSVSGGARVEIKGAQELKCMEKLIENEARRQMSLIEIKKDLNERGTAIGNVRDSSDIFSDSKNAFVRKTLESGGKVYSLVMKNSKGILGRKLFEGKTFSNELADYARAWGVRGMIHSEENLSGYNLEKEFEKLLVSGDNAIIIAGGRDARKALEAVRERIIIASERVPEETRAADGAASKYMRPLPGSARMYPETDVKPIPVPRKMLKRLEPLEEFGEKIDRYIGMGLPEQVAKAVVRSNHISLFERLSAKHEPKLVAVVMTEMSKKLSREGIEVSAGNIEKVFYMLDKGRITKGQIEDALRAVSSGKEFMPDVLGEHEIQRIIEEVIRANPGLNEKAYMGLIMKKAGGKAGGAEVMKILKGITKSDNN